MAVSGTPRNYARALLEANLAYATRGWHTIEIRPDDKKPFHKGWRNTATVDPDRIKALRSPKGRPLARIGIPMGRQPNGDVLIALDEDRNGVLAEFATARGEVVQATWQEKTRRGMHHVYKLGRRRDHLDDLLTNCKLAEKLDVIINGYIVVAPSLASDGVTHYRVVDNRDPEVLPDWLFMAIFERSKTTTHDLDATSAERPSEDEILKRYRQTYAMRVHRAAKLIAKHPIAVQGEDGRKTLFRLCIGLVRGLAIRQSDAYAMIIRDYNSRCVPPWGGGELAEIKAFVADAEHKSNRPWCWLLTEGSGIEARWKASGSVLADSDAARVAPSTLATVEIVGWGESGLWLKIVDGPRAGVVRPRPMNWPPTESSKYLWQALAAAIGVDAVRDPHRDTFGRRVRYELLEDHHNNFKFGRVFAALPTRLPPPIETCTNDEGA